jgi:opacity protein-like surface antigen
MKQRTCLRFLIVGVALLGLLALPAADSAAQDKIRAAGGVYGIYGIPVIQDNVAAGPLYGIKARADLTGPLGAELSFTSFPAGDVTFKARGVDQTTKGYGQSVIAADLILQTTGASGFGIYLLGGVGSYSLSKDNAADISRIGFNGGLGVEFRSSSGIAVDICGRLHAMPYENGGTHKFAALQAGVNYYFLR